MIKIKSKPFRMVFIAISVILLKGLDFLRHAYCIYRLKEWAEQGRDLMVLIPMMRTYLGHHTFSETAYYLRWTADVFPDIRMKLRCVMRASSRRWRIFPMKPTDFSMHLTAFLSDYLPIQKNVSRNTIKSYRDTFKLLLLFCEKEEGIPVERITMKKLSSELVVRFLNWLETDRKSSISTRNLRLTAIHSLFRYTQSESPESLYPYQKVLAIPMKKKRQAVVEHLSPEGIKVLLEQPDRTTAQGRRDLTLLSLMYDSGARVQEIIDLAVKDFIPGSNPVLILTGKGNKTRRVPIMKNTASLVEKYISENRLDMAHKAGYPIFTNKQHNKLTKEGVSYVINKYVVMAHGSSSQVPEKVRCHMLRHSKAVHLLQAGINLIYIRDFLGHSDIKTTEIYAKADVELKRKALENAYPDLVDSNLPDWSESSDLMEWLSEL